MASPSQWEDYAKKLNMLWKEIVSKEWNLAQVIIWETMFQTKTPQHHLCVLTCFYAFSLNLVHWVYLFPCTFLLTISLFQHNIILRKLPTLGANFCKSIWHKCMVQRATRYMKDKEDVHRYARRDHSWTTMFGMPRLTSSFTPFCLTLPNLLMPSNSSAIFIKSV